MTLYLLTYSMQRNPSSESNRFSASQEIPRNLWNPKVYYRIYKCLLPDPILSRINPVHTSHSTSWIFILILSSHLRLGLPSGVFITPLEWNSVLYWKCVQQQSKFYV